MEYNDTYEREIDLKELMFAVLRKWRIVLFFALALAVLFGGYKAAGVYKSNRTEVEDDHAKEVEAYNESMESYEREIENLTRDIASQEEYMEKSILMNMSPYDVWEAKAEIFIKADERTADQGNDLTTTIMRAYQAALTSSELLSEIAKEMGVDRRYIQELVTITMGRDSYYGDDELFNVNGGGFIIRNRQNDFLTVQVRYKDEEKAKELLESFVEGGKKFQNQIKSSIGPHTISEVSSSVSSRIDFTLADQQNNERARLERLRESLKTRTDEMENLKSPEESAVSSPVSTGIKYGVIGGVLGAFAVVFFICIGFVMSDKVYSAKELKYRFKVKILGTLSTGEKNKSKIDAMIRQLEGRTCGADRDHELGLITANIRNHMDGMHSLLVIGTAQEEVINGIASELAERLSEIKVVFGGNILHNAEGLLKLPECDGAVLVEACKDSLYSAVELEIERICDLQKTVVGCVVYE